MIEAKSNAPAEGGSFPQVERRRRLSLPALAIVNDKVEAAYSPVVIAGVVRLIDFLLIIAVGAAVYHFYVVPIDGFVARFIAAIAAFAAATIVAFQASDLYQVQMLRTRRQQITRLLPAWALAFLLFTAVSFFAKLGSQVSRVWLFAFLIIGF